MLEQHGGYCHICGLPCDFSGAHPRLRITRDHILPRSKGGTWMGANLKPAHAYCNYKRGNGDITSALKTACLSWIQENVTANDLRKAELSFIDYKPVSLKTGRKIIARITIGELLESKGIRLFCE